MLETKVLFGSGASRSANVMRPPITQRGSQSAVTVWPWPFYCRVKSCLELHQSHCNAEIRRQHVCDFGRCVEWHVDLRYPFCQFTLQRSSWFSDEPIAFVPSFLESRFEAVWTVAHTMFGNRSLAIASSNCSYRHERSAPLRGL